MAEPVHRFAYLGVTVTTTVEIVDGIPLVFVDVFTPEGHPNIAIGWGTKWERFGVYADGVEVFPFQDDDASSKVTATDVGEGLPTHDEGTVQ